MINLFLEEPIIIHMLLKHLISPKVQIPILEIEAPDIGKRHLSCQPKKNHLL
jgi:hypothetical protein